MIIWMFAEETLESLLRINAYVTLKEVRLLLERRDSLLPLSKEIVEVLHHQLKYAPEKENAIENYLVDMVVQNCKGCDHALDLFLSDILDIDIRIRFDNAARGIAYALKNPFKSLHGECLKHSYRFLNRKDCPEYLDKAQFNEDCIVRYMRLNQDVLSDYLPRFDIENCPM